MSRYINCPQDQIRNILNNVEAQLRRGKLENGKFNFSYEIPNVETEKINLIFSELAYIKMLALVTDYLTEVQWHGIVERIDNTTFRVTDVIVFPHETTGTTVTSDATEYSDWLNSLDDDTFNHLRFHGHSHVDMGVTPSYVDTTYRANLISTISPDDDNPFYIFIILNKKNQINCQVFDIINNIVYDNFDIITTVEIGELDILSDFLNNAHSIAKTKTYTPPSTTVGNTTTGNNNQNQNKKKENNKYKKYGGNWEGDKWKSYEQTIIDGYGSDCKDCSFYGCGDCYGCPNYGSPRTIY